MLSTKIPMEQYLQCIEDILKRSRKQINEDIQVYKELRAKLEPSFKDHKILTVSSFYMYLGHTQSAYELVLLDLGFAQDYFDTIKKMLLEKVKKE